MKRVKWAALLLAVALLLPAAGGAATAEHLREGDINKAAGNLEIPPGERVNGNITVNMGEIEVLGTVNGNVNNNMGQVMVPGEVNGNVEANMGQVTVTGSVSGDVTARMGEVIVEGAVGGKVSAELGSVRIRGTVAGDVDSGLGELRIPGKVLGSVSSQGKNVIITGTVGGDVFLARGIVELGPGSEVGGRICVEQGMAKIDEGARVGPVEVGEELSEAEIDRLFGSGGYRFRGIDNLAGLGDLLERSFGGIGRAFSKTWPLSTARRITPWTVHSGWPGNLARGLLNMVVLFALAALTFSLFPQQVQITGEAVHSRTGAVIGWGLLALILAAPLALLLAVTIIGIPLILVEILALALAGILGYTALSRFVGEKIAGAASTATVNPLGAIALGVLILGLISMVPLAGFLITLFAFVLAVGAALATRFGSLNQAPDACAALPASESEEKVSPEERESAE